MKLQFVAAGIFAILLVSVTMANVALAEKDTAKNGIKTIMENYRKAILKAQADFLAAVDKANEDARNAVYEGVLTIDEINTNSKAAIDKARADLKNSIQDARADAKAALLALKAEVDARASN